MRRPAIASWRERGPGAGATGFGRVQLGGLLVLATGAVIGLGLWSKWGFLVAFDALVRYCF